MLFRVCVAEPVKQEINSSKYNYLNRTKKMKKKLYETPVCTVIPLATEYALLTKSPVARPGGGGETGHKGSVSVGEFEDGGSEEIEDED